jgi:flagellar biosynthetic protein FlhB
MARDSAQRTEPPTPKRKREARERGQIAKTPELLTWISLLATTVLLQVTVAAAADGIGGLVAQVGPVTRRPSVPGAIRFLLDGLEVVAVSVVPLALGLMVVGVVVELAQAGLRPSFKRVKPKGERLNVFKGLKRIFSGRSLWETAKAALRILIITAVAWPAASGVATELVAGGSIITLARTTAEGALGVVRNVAAAGLVLAAVDYLVQRRRVQRDLRMTRPEVREELRQSEGDPHVRDALRSKARLLSRNRMIASVATADVVLLNPTHVAVALQYSAERGSPQVVAKGMGLVAATIRAEAEEHRVPLVEDPPLARLLHRVCEIGDHVPVELYEAVARVLAFVWALGATARASSTARRMPGSSRPLPEVGRRRRHASRSLRSRVSVPISGGSARTAPRHATTHGRSRPNEAL